MSIADEADPSRISSSEFHPLPSIQQCHIHDHHQQQQPTEDDSPTADPTIPPVPKPRTIKLSPCGTRKPLPPPRKPLLSSFVNIRPTQVERPPVNVIIDLNNSLWRNIQIQDMEKKVTKDESVMAILPEQPSSSKVQRPRNRRSYDSASECDIESISVQMEDLTSSEADLNPAFASGSFETDRIIGGVDKTMMRMGPEWVVPLQYSNSPIVQELAESGEERPKPPLVNHYASAVTMQVSASKTPPHRRVSLLERIVRSHPIWYLQHLGRPAATHLLKQMEPGNFIVRSSSKPGCMAISVRLPSEHEALTDHYIVQYGTRGNVIRLESSPYSFSSLPLLIEHYCLHPEELQICLCLPYAVLACQTTKELQSLALLGQDFWTSETALMRSPSRTSDMSSTQSTSFMNLDECLPRIAPTLQRSSGYRNNVPKLGKLSKPKKRSSTGRDSGVTGDMPFALQTESRRDVAGNQNDVNSSSPPMKCDRAEESPREAGHISRSERRTQSVRTKSVNPPPVSGSSSTGRRSFLKTLFFGGGGSSNSSQNRRDPINQLAHCQYFVPFEKETVRSSKSAFEIGSPSKVDDWSKKHHANQMSTFKPSYDEVVMSARVCPLPMRRERSDLCASSVMRLARHTERSPGPACTMSTAIKPLQTKVPKRQPLRPPDTACDPKTISNCIDELRRRRLQFTNEKAAEQPSQISSPQISLRQRNNWDSNQQNGDEVPRYTSRASQRDHRMSVPNLSPEPSSVVIQSAKALREKLGRNGDGELSTINEGLITPVIRRKQFNQPSTLTFNVNNDAVHPNSPSAKRASHTDSPSTLVSRGREALEALFAHQQNTSPPNPAPEGLARRFNSERGVRGGREKGSSTTAASKRGSCFFPNKVGLTNWSAINSELKSKQKIAKVRPTLQARVPPSIMTVDAISTKNSEYAQLSEFTSPDGPKPDIKREDDTVSVAGTVFNEPWDSNVWENLLDLASHGDEGISPRSRRLSDTIQEEDSESDRTPAGSTRMHESEDESDDDMWVSMTASSRRVLPSDRVTCKAWENDDISNYGTIDSHLDESYTTGTLRKADRRARTPPHSMHSLPRAVSRYSHQIGSLDDLPLSLPALSPNLNSGRKTSQAESSAAIQTYVERLAEDESTVFGATLKRFIECTVQSEEADPNVVVRNVRQFINGIKNYLVKHGEGDLHGLIDQESSHLNANQILNIDAILEAVLHKLLLKRVKPHLYHVMVKEHSRAGGLQALSSNIAYVKTLSLAELGFADADQLVTPSASVMEQIKNCLRKMQHHYSPLKKLENLLRAISIVLALQTKDDEKESQKIMAADDLVRWLLYILARSSTVGCEVEAWYMWELLPQQMITKGDAAYYLTALFSAIHILKSIDAIKKLAERDEDMVASMDLSRQFCSPSPSCPSDAFVKVAIPDEVAGCIRYATFPGVPQMTTGKLCRVIAHQQGITNPEDHGLYLIVNGYESCLLPHECPDAIRDNLRGTGKPHLFAYKRHDAKIGWPRQVMSTPG
ncbi:hypothetical protein V3C99_015087 [Haemonchus contortus]